ncbi:ribbon-helix-helix protein, CopG family [Vulcanisaeta thermophila]|uniref:ribbon-helix-helix protein, CopG family n=1 Tax=Vulcanisaeta thermophila TaxID=867917 RepID=UPI000853D4A0|nr:ribbon-helix-helix protein, CopG family [Vulcanisaeta thermophila]
MGYRSIRVTEDVYRRINELATEWGVSMSEVVKRLLEGRDCSELEPLITELRTTLNELRVLTSELRHIQGVVREGVQSRREDGHG